MVAKLEVTLSGPGLELGRGDGRFHSFHEEGIDGEQLLLALDGDTAVEEEVLEGLWVGRESSLGDVLEQDLGGGLVGVDFGHGVVGVWGCLLSIR